MENKKRIRSKNISERDKYLLLELVQQDIETMENNKTDSNRNKGKRNCWEKITQSFNAQHDSGIRTSDQLKYLHYCLFRETETAFKINIVIIFRQI